MQARYKGKRPSCGEAIAVLGEGEALCHRPADTVTQSKATYQSVRKRA